MSGEVGEGGGFAVEGGDGFDKPGDGEGVADASGLTDKAEDAAFPRELDGDSNERRNAGAIDLWNAVEKGDDFARTAFDDGLQCRVKLLGRFTDGEASANFDDRHAGRISDVDFHGQAYRHKSELTKPLPLL